MDTASKNSNYSFALICINEEREIVSVYGFSTKEEARRSLYEQVEAEYDCAVRTGYGESERDKGISDDGGYVVYGEMSYEWHIRRIEDYF